MDEQPDPDPSEEAFASGGTDGERPITHSTDTLVGRTRELEELTAGLGSALAGRGCVFLLSGEPGIGKSRLADEFAATANSHGARVLWGRCWEAGGAPAYWPWVQLLRVYLRSEESDTIREQMGAGATDIAQMLPEVHDLIPELPPPPTVDPESARFRLFDSTAKFLLNAASVQPLTLVLDDLQSADIPSLLLLRFLAGQLTESRILILGAYRDVEVTPDHPLTQTISELAREPVTRHIALRGLDEMDVGRYIETTTGAVAGALLSSSLYRQTNGNPLFLGEAVRLLVTERRLGEDADPSTLRITVPPGIREVIARRVEHLGEAKDALVLASVLGPEFGLEPVRRLGDVSADELLELLGEAVGAGLLDEVPGGVGRFRFSHDLFRETLYEELRPARRIRLHRRLAQILEEMHGRDIEEHLAELAHHFFEGAPGGDVERAVDYARRAGDQAAQSLAYEEAVRLYQMGLQALELSEKPASEMVCELLLAIGEAQARAGNLPSARETFLRAAGIARRIDGTQLARAALGYGGRFVWARVGSDPHLVSMLQDALVLHGERDDRLRVRLLSRLACALRSSPDREHSAALSRQAVEMARGLDDPSTLAYALMGRFGAVWWPENPKERLEIGRELLRVAEEARDAERIVDGHITTFFALTELGAIAEARTELEAMERVAEELRQPAQMWVVWSLSAQLALLEGAFGAAEGLIREALRLSPVTPVRDNTAAARFQLYLLRREQGQGAEVEEAVRASIREFPWYPLFRGALACLLMDQGRREEAMSVFAELARNGFRDLNRDNEWLLGMSLLSEACVGLGDVEAAATLYEQLLPFGGRLAVGHAEGGVGAVDRYLGLLAETLGRLEEADGHYRRSVELNDRMGARPWVAHTQHDHARMLLSRDRPGDRERAIELAADAGRTATALDMTSLERRTRELLGELGLDVLVEAATDSGDLAAPIGPAVFRQEGEYFSIAYEGEAFRLKDTKGLRYLAHLLANPGREVHAIDLATLGEGGPVRDGASGVSAERAGLHSRGAGDAGDVLDPQARAAYKRRLLELKEDLDEAESFGDAERAAQAREEMDILAQHLAGATGLGGRSRRTVSPAERARVSVTKAIKVALGRIARHSSTLGHHLERTVHTGTFCSYAPDPRAPVAWRT